MVKCTNSSINVKRCTCTYEGCARHGICCECVVFHRGQGELPGCFFSAADERTYDRGVAFFVSRSR